MMSGSHSKELTEERQDWRIVMISWVTLQSKSNKHDVMVITVSVEEEQFILTEKGNEIKCIFFP